MQAHECVRRALAATCATLAIAAVPSTASATPASEQQHRAVSVGTALELEQVLPGGEPATTTGGGDQILTLVLSGAALLVALGSAGYADRVGHRVAEPSH